jgi:integrase
MTQPFRFTEERIEKIPTPEDGRVYYKDATTKGLRLTVYPTGSKVFVLYRKVQGRPERVFIGQWPELPVVAAIKKADEMNGDIAQGKNPAEERRTKRLEGTFKSLWLEYLADHAKVNKRPKSVSEDEGIRARYLKELDTRRLSSITRGEVRALHARIGRKHGIYAANRTLSLLSTIFNFAIKVREWDGENPCTGIAKFEEQPRERFLNEDEMGRFIKALSNEPDLDFGELLTLALFTGARRNNIMSMRFNEVDFTGATWTIPSAKAKGKRAVVIPLVAPALVIVKSRRKRFTGEWVFPSAFSECGHITEFRKPWNELLKRAEISDLRFHDVRRTVGSWMSKAGAVLPVIKRALAHQDITTTQIYTQSEDSQVRKAFEDATTKMLGTGESNGESNTAAK